MSLKDWCPHPRVTVGGLDQLHPVFLTTMKAVVEIDTSLRVVDHEVEAIEMRASKTTSSPPGIHTLPSQSKKVLGTEIKDSQSS
jgi:hypothetical protein